MVAKSHAINGASAVQAVSVVSIKFGCSPMNTGESSY
jgi:hypothetical protein